MAEPVIRSLQPADRDWVRKKMVDEWGAEFVVVHGELFHPAELPGFVICAGQELVGLITFRFDGPACEIMTVNTWNAGAGMGGALIDHVRRAALGQDCRRLYLVTTNDNTRALRFYQRLGFTIATVRLNALETSRKLKPGIPLIGEDGIPLRDEIELEMVL